MCSVLKNFPRFSFFSLICFQLIVSPFLPQMLYAQEVSTHREQIQEEHYTRTAKEFNQRVKSLRKFIFGKGKGTHPLDTFSLLGQNVHTFPDLRRPFNIKNLLVEIVDRKEKTLGIIGSRAQHMALALDEQYQKLYQGTSWKGRAGEKNFLRISYNGRVLHTLPMGIRWAAMMGTTLVFLENSRISNRRAFISFIDLDYFQTAVGKTALPVFHIPVYFGKERGEERRKELQGPQKISADYKGIQIDGLSLTKEQVWFLSRLQQLSFNATVSFVDVEDFEGTREYVKELVKVYTESLEKNHQKTIDSFGADTTNSYKKLKELIENQLAFRTEIGSIKNSTGPLSALKRVERKLKASSGEEKFFKDFMEHLDQDVHFQQAVGSLNQEMINEKKFFNRIKAFLSRITRPRPLGSPKIKRALGLIANSVLPGETLVERGEVFREGLAQFFANPWVRGGISVLAGAGVLASGHTAEFFYQGLEAGGVWLGHWKELAGVTWDAGFSWVNSGSANGFYSSYFANGRAFNLAAGLASFVGVAALFWGSIHYSINWKKFKEHLKNDSELKNKREKFIAYIEKERKVFLEDLSMAEKRKIGLGMALEFQDGQTNRLLFRTASRWQNLIKSFQGDEPLTLELEVTDADGVHDKVEFISIAEYAQGLDLAEGSEQLSIEINPGKDVQIKRIFRLVEGDISYVRPNHKEGTKMIGEFSGESLSIKGEVVEADFSPREEKLLLDALAQLRQSHDSINEVSQDGSSFREIKTLKKALLHFTFGFSSWKHSFRFGGLLWNWFFLSRNIVFRPRAGIPLLYYSRFFNRVYRQKHWATELNGGRDSRLRDMMELAVRFPGMDKKRDFFKSLNDFEEKIIAIEKKYIKTSFELTFYESVKKFSEKPSLHHAIRQGNKFTAPLLKGKERLFFEIYQRELFEEGVREYLLEQIEIEGRPTNRKLRRHIVEKSQHEQGFDWMKAESTEDVRQRLRRISKEKNIVERTEKALNNLFKGAPKRMKVKNEFIQEDKLTPERSLVMERFEISEKMLNDPESLSRAVRQNLTNLVIDKPIELLFTFIFLAGVDHGILQLLHDQAFSENSWFYLSRYVMWTGFFTGITVWAWAGVWMKVQMDHRLDSMGGFDKIPTLKDVNKRFAGLRWFAKQYMDKNNTMAKNYLYSARLSIANISAFFLTSLIFGMATLGRFDLDIFLNVYIVAFLTPLSAWYFKMENAFEQFVNFSLKDLIKKGIDFNGQHKKLLGHPELQDYKMHEAARLRRRYNLKLALFFDNPIGNLIGIFENIDTSVGSRAFQRLLLGGNLATEYYVNLIDFLHGKGLPEGVSNACKSLLTNNRTDLMPHK